MIQEAVAFARKAHQGAVRKGTNIPYIMHPLEAGVIVSMMTRDEDVIVAAVLHDVAEDAGVTREELERHFNSRVADLVMEESEDKSKSWAERKGDTLKRLRTACRDVKMIALGDKLSNMRSTAKDYLVIGDRIWERFNEKDKAQHAWYYLGIADALSDLKEYPSYQEYVDLCDLVFHQPCLKKNTPKV